MFYKDRAPFSTKAIWRLKKVGWNVAYVDYMPNGWRKKKEKLFNDYRINIIVTAPNGRIWVEVNDKCRTYTISTSNLKILTYGKIRDIKRQNTLTDEQILAELLFDVLKCTSTI